MAPTFGTRLRLQREEQQIQLAAIAEQTKIKISLLEALERDDVSRWPRGIFRRSYFRAYASAIGLEPDSALREFRGLFPDPDEAEDVAHALAHAHHIQGYQPQRPPTRLRCLIDSAVNALPALHLQGIPRNGTRIETKDLPLTAPELPVTPAALDHEPLPPAESNMDAYEPPAPPEAELPLSPVVAAGPAPVVVNEQPGVDLSEVARLCTRLACALDVCDITPVLEEAVHVLRADGLIVWVRDSAGRVLSPVFVHGYPGAIRSQLAPVLRESDNALARAFRAGQMQVVDGDEVATGAVVVPLLTPGGCAGVLALELKHRVERLECVRAAATILAAQLSMLLGVPALGEAVSA